MAIMNVKKEIQEQLQKKGLSKKEIHLLQLLAGLKKNKNWWARQDSNLGPIHYECTALTN